MRRLRSLFTLFLLVTLAACDSGPGSSLYDPGAADGDAPVIASVSPNGIVLAGVDEITIEGQHFSSTASDNLVFFDDGAGNVAKGTVLSATETQLRVKVPNLANTALRLRVAVSGAANFSNEVPFPLTPAFVQFGALDSGVLEEVFAMTPDGAGGVLASLLSNGSSAGIVRFAADGSRSPYFASPNTWSGLTRGLDGMLYGVRRLRAAFRLPEGGRQQTLVGLGTSVSLSKIVTGPTGDLYAAGSSTDPATAAIYRITTTGESTPTPFPNPVTALVVHDRDLYVGTTTSSESQVLRFPISEAGDLGTPELVYDLTADVGANFSVTALAIAADGTMYVGSDAPNPIIEVMPDGTSAPLYPGVLHPPVASFAWGEGSSLYVANASIPPLVAGGPTTPAALYRLETRRQGPL